MSAALWLMMLAVVIYLASRGLDARFWIVLLIGLAGVGALHAIVFFGLDYVLRRLKAHEDRVLAEMDDPVFGTIRLYKDRGWEGEVQFAPTDSRVGVSIRAESNGPSDQQRELFKEIESRYPGLRASIEQSLCKHVGDEFPFKIEFELVDIEIDEELVPGGWTCQFVPKEVGDPNSELGDMGYFVDVVAGKVAAVTTVD
jgi:hypothetical protein